MTDDLLDEVTRKIPAGYVQMNWTQGFGRQIGPLYEKVCGTKYVRAFSVEEHHTNGMKNCHGGMLMAFADVAFGTAISIHMSRWWVTVRLLTDFVSSAKVGDWVEGNAEITGVEDDLVSVKGRVWCGDRTILTGTGIFKALDRRA